MANVAAAISMLLFFEAESCVVRLVVVVCI